MKYVLFLASFVLPAMLYAQNLNPVSVSASYFGEAVTHPGLKLAVNYQITSWNKSKTWSSGKTKTIDSNIGISPTVGFFYHKNYQTSIFVLPEFSYTRKKINGNFVIYGLGAGYMRTFVPNVYDLNTAGEVIQTHAGYNYFLTNYFVAFGKDLNMRFETPLSVYLKPQLMYAMPAPSGVWYFAVELGVTYRL